MWWSTSTGGSDHVCNMEITDTEVICDMCLQLGTSKVEQGGVYTLVVTRDEETHQLRSVLFPLTSPNTVHMLWQVPQYVIITVS